MCLATGHYLWKRGGTSNGGGGGGVIGINKLLEGWVIEFFQCERGGRGGGGGSKNVG